MKIDVVEEFIALASLNSLSRREGAVAEYLIGRLRELGLDAVVDDSAPRAATRETSWFACRATPPGRPFCSALTWTP